MTSFRSNISSILLPLTNNNIIYYGDIIDKYLDLSIYFIYLIYLFRFIYQNLYLDFDIMNLLLFAMRNN